MKNQDLVILAFAALAFCLFVKNQDCENDDSSADIEDYANQAQEQLQKLTDGDIDFMTANKNLTAFLRAIRYGEGTAGGNGYQILCGGKTFDSFADHPALRGWTGLPLSDSMCKAAGFGAGCVSTAAGAYQINKPTWRGLVSKLGLSDFSPDSQDRAAIELISQRGALQDVYAGRIDSAVSKCAKVWASLPSAGYGQHEVSMNSFISNFENEGGAVA